MRVGEAIRPNRNDLDHESGVILIRESRFGKSRLVPVDASTLGALRDYRPVRRCWQPISALACGVVGQNCLRSVGKSDRGRTRTRHRRTDAQAGSGRSHSPVMQRFLAHSTETTEEPSTVPARVHQAHGA